MGNDLITEFRSASQDLGLTKEQLIKSVSFNPSITDLLLITLLPLYFSKTTHVFGKKLMLLSVLIHFAK